MTDHRAGGKAPRFRLAYLVALLAIGPLAAIACGSSDSATTATQAQSCSLNSDCAAGLKCALGRCRVACKTAADCAGGSCISDGVNAVCQPAAEKNTPCDRQADCPVPLACASDYRCRNLCTGDADCNVLGISGRRCAKDGQGVFYCGETAEVSAEDLLIASPAPGHAAGPVEEPAGLGTDGGGISSGGDGGTGNGGDGAVSDGASEASVVNNCPTACGVGTQCVGTACVACGASGGPCCGNQCGTSLTCSGGTCVCGTPGAACCGGTTCNNGVNCVSGTCACGGAGQACCPAASGPSTCTGSLTCAGKACGCVLGLQGNMIQRSDGALFYTLGTLTPIKTIGGGNFVAKGFSFDLGANIGCGVQADGTVACFNTGGSTANGSGQLGNGGTTGGAVPAAVVTDGSGTTLKNVKSVAVGLGAACAVDTAGSVWCWGRGTSGELGNGFMNSSTVAVQVLTSSGGAPFTGAVQVAIGDNQVCAVKGDGANGAGSLWCWGSNAQGRLGIGQDAGTFSTPQQVSALFSNVTAVMAYDANTCAITSDGSGYCWGANSSGQLANGATGAPVTTPLKLPLTGVKTLVGVSNAMYALKTDGSLLFWGNGQSFTPVPYVEQSFPITGVSIISTDHSYLSYLGPDGQGHVQGSAIPLVCN